LDSLLLRSPDIHPVFAVCFCRELACVWYHTKGFLDIDYVNQLVGLRSFAPTYPSINLVNFDDIDR
jgi:hypothetical protein